MKILSLTTSFPHPDNESSGIFVFHLLAALAEKHHVTVITPSFHGLQHISPNSNMTVMSCRYAPASLETLAHAPGGVPAALRSNIIVGTLLLFLMLLSLFFRTFVTGLSKDIIHANWAVCGLIALPLKLFRKKIIVTLRGEDVTRAQKKKLSRYVLGLVIYFADHIITVSRDMKIWIDEIYNKPDKVTFIGNGIADEFLSVGKARDYSAQQPVVECVMVGSLIPRKNLAFVLRGLHQISSRRLWSLAIIGDGPEKEQLRSLVHELGMDRKIVFCGGQSQDFIVAKLRTAQVFLFSSKSEGRPNVIIEAMAAGLAIIAPRISGVNELIEHANTGMLFESENTMEFVSIVEKLFSEIDSISELGQSAHHYIVSHVGSWQAVADRYDIIFREQLRV